MVRMLMFEDIDVEPRQSKQDSHPLPWCFHSIQNVFWVGPLHPQCSQCLPRGKTKLRDTSG